MVLMFSFFLRHVDTRWLESVPALERFLDHWDSTVEYFMEYIPHSSNPNNKNALKSDTYKAISVHLCLQERTKTKIRAKVLLMVAQLTKPFLTMMQSVKPMIHVLLSAAGDMFRAIARVIVKPEKISSTLAGIKAMKLTSSSGTSPSCLLDSKDCKFVACIRGELNSLEKQDRVDVRLECRRGIRAMLLYLQNNIPFDSLFLLHVSFLDPRKRTGPDVVNYGVAAATHLNRFTDEELVKLSSQLVLYQALPEDKVATHRGDRVDHYWGEIFKLLKDAAGGVRQSELELLVKLCCTLSHGNAMLERGMGHTKRIVDGRESMGITTLKALKVVSQVN